MIPKGRHFLNIFSLNHKCLNWQNFQCINSEKNRRTLLSKKRATPAQKLLWRQTLTTKAVLEVRRSFMIVVILTEGAIPTTQCDNDDDDDNNMNYNPSPMPNSLALPPPLPLLWIPHTLCYPQKAFNSCHSCITYYSLHPLHYFSDIILFSNWQNINWWSCLTGIL